jgi:hypothetical protein
MRDIVVPRHRYVADIIARLSGLPPTDARVVRAVASVQAQLLLFARPLPRGVPAEWRAVLADTDAIVEHVLQFSLGGIRAL